MHVLVEILALARRVTQEIVKIDVGPLSAVLFDHPLLYSGQWNAKADRPVPSTARIRTVASIDAEMQVCASVDGTARIRYVHAVDRAVHAVHSRRVRRPGRSRMVIGRPRRSPVASAFEQLNAILQLPVSLHLHLHELLQISNVLHALREYYTFVGFAAGLLLGELCRGKV